MASINYINNPPFDVDLREYTRSQLRDEDEKTRKLAFTLFRFIGIVATSAAKATLITLSYSVTSFKHIVLGIYNDRYGDLGVSNDLALMVFRVAFWVVGLIWCATTTTNRLIVEELFPASKKFLNDFAMEGINVDHIRTNEIAIDVSNVDPKVKVHDLLDIYEQINFTKPDEPGYMAPNSRAEGPSPYSIKELRESLNVFVKNVNGRVPFLGTPPGYDTPRLMAFYQQIENAVRFSLDASNKQIAEFKEVNGEDLTQYNDQTMKKFKGLLEDRARIAIDLAIAGNHCGARFLGESMNVYENLQSETLAHKGSLQECLVELLAKKRYKIARSQIEIHLGADTHSYNKYMANLGKILGLPGTENMIEHLDTKFDQNWYLKLFFEEYTVDTIIDTIQEEVNKSQVFREKITDWIKDQSADWQKDYYQAEAVQLNANVMDVLQQPVDPQNPEWVLFSELAQALEHADQFPLLEDKWDDFLNTLFNLEAVKQWRDAKFPVDQVLAALVQEGENVAAFTPPLRNMKVLAFRKRKVEMLKAFCMQPAVAPEELALLATKPKEELIEALRQRFLKRIHIENVRKIAPLEVETVARLLDKPDVEREQFVKEVVEAKEDLERRNTFLAQIAAKHFIEKDIGDEKREYELTPELIEWVAVSQGIFTPQAEGEK